MKVQLDRTFAVPAGAEAAWGMLRDLEAVAQCMPGATITERSDERHFKGTVTVRMGPATMSFRGEIEVLEIDPAAHSLRLAGKGTDTTGGSGASMNLRARIDPAGEASTLVGASEVTMSGKAAAFGARAFGAVADQVLKQFGTNFAKQAAARAARPPDAPGGASTVAAAAAATSSPAGPVGAPVPLGADVTPARELNALALLWSAFTAWLRALFRKSAT